MVDGNVRGRVIIVTGASRGIGKGLAHYLGSQGASLVITGRRPDRLEAVASDLEKEGVPHLAVAGNVSDQGAMNDLAAAAAAEFGRIDGLVANAQSFISVKPLEEVTSDDMDRLLDTGPKATLWTMQAVLPYMKKQGGGRIVTMGTAMGMTGAAGYGPYAASKEAIRALTRTAAREWGKYGVTVNCVLPASVAHRLPPGDDARTAAFRDMYADHPLGRDGDPQDDIAPAVTFLLSDASRYVTGHTMMVDGGGVMRA